MQRTEEVSMCSADLHEKLTPGNSWDGNKMKGIESDQENWVFATGLLSVCLDLYLPSPNPLSKSWRVYVCVCVSVCLWSCVMTTCPTNASNWWRISFIFSIISGDCAAQYAFYPWRCTWGYSWQDGSGTLTNVHFEFELEAIYIHVTLDTYSNNSSRGLNCDTLQKTKHYSAIRCNILRVTGYQIRQTMTHCNTLRYTATHFNTVQHTLCHRISNTPNCETPQHTATHCNTLQHTAIPCNTRSTHVR